MSVYLLCIQPPLAHAAHYCGFSEAPTVDRRVNEHLSGGSKASPLIVAALMAGRTVTLARRWDGDQYDRAFERYLKTRDSQGRRNRCPYCRAHAPQTKTQANA